MSKEFNKLSDMDNLTDEELLKKLVGESGEKKKDGFFLNFVAGLLLIALFVGCAFWYGFVGMMLWNWFLVPLGVVSITFWHAMGLVMLVTYFVTNKKYQDIEKTDPKVFAKVFWFAISYPAIALLFGWLYFLGI